MLPREKLEKFGAAKLSIAELLALILRHGSKRESIFKIVNRILSQTGPYGIKMTQDIKSKMKELGLGPVQSSQIIASIELGKRLFGRGELQIRSIEDIIKHVEDIRSAQKEVLRGLYVSSTLDIIADEVISIGTLDKNLVHPREVLIPAVRHGAHGFFLVHNHPSGAPDPSNEDIRVTIAIQSAARMMQIELLDHIIVAKNGCFSFFNEGLLANPPIN